MDNLKLLIKIWNLSPKIKKKKVNSQRSICSLDLVITIYAIAMIIVRMYMYNSLNNHNS
jgi:hypothetical protein